MKKKLLVISIILFIGVSMSFYSCKKDKENVGDANLTGIVISSQTGDGLANATLYFTRNLSATDYNNADYTVTTDQYGNFTVTNAVAGTYLVFVVSNGFFVNSFQVILVTGTNTINDILLVEAPQAGELRIILTWGVSPSDLDSHLTGPDGSGGRFHMYYSSKTPSPYISLDVDDTSSEGPETTTISGHYNGMYRFSVHNYSNKYEATGGNGIKTSPAKVELYNSTGLVQTFNPPTFTGNGDTWRVFELTYTGNSYTISVKNVYVMATSTSDMNIFKSTNKKVEQLNFDNF